MSASEPLAPYNPSADARRRARLFWEQSGEDFKLAGKRLKRGDYLECGYFSLQAALNALSAVCLLHGHVQLPQTSAVHLLALCIEIDARFAPLAETCQALERAAEANPFRAEQDSEKQNAQSAQEHHQRGREIVTSVGVYLKAHR